MGVDQIVTYSFYINSTFYQKPLIRDFHYWAELVIDIDDLVSIN